MPTLHLIRHATYALLGERLGGRLPGQHLSDAGRAQAAALAAALAAVKLDLVLSSPLERAVETAGPIAEVQGCAVQIEADFDEIDFGNWTGLRFDELAHDQHWQHFNRFRSTAPIPSGETMLRAQSRAVAAVQRLAARHPGAAIAIVTHGDIVKAVLAHFLGLPLDMFGRLAIDPASRSILQIYQADAAILGVNLPPPEPTP